MMKDSLEMLPLANDSSVFSYFLLRVNVILKGIAFITFSLILLVGIPGSVAQPIPIPLLPGEERNTRIFVEETKFFRADGLANEAFGSAVALSADGSIALIGAYNDETGVAAGVEGAAYVYRWNGSAWTFIDDLNSPDASADDWFGWSVALNAAGTTALIGAVREDPLGNTDEGAAYVYIWNGSSWVFQQKLSSSEPASTDFFAQSVSLSADGNTAMIGASDYDNPGTNQGAAFVFTRSGGVWTQQGGALKASDAQAGDLFGKAVRLSADGNTAVIGSHENTVGGNANQGAAYVFIRSGTIWTEQDILTASDGAVDDLFGWTVGLSSDGNTAIVGAFSDTVGATSNQGSAYIFTRSGSVWTQRAQLTADDGEADDDFGDNVALSGDGQIAIVGAAYNDNAGPFHRGAAYVFTGSGSAWTQRWKLTASDAGADDLFGVKAAISTDGSVTLLGAQGDTIGTNANQGSAYIFRNSFTICADVFTIPTEECDALVDLYNSTGGEDWTNHVNWFENPDPCNWTGIDCVNRHISNIKLDDNNLVGTLPTSLGDLTNLETLEVNSNALSGTIPTELGSLEFMFNLDLSNNQLTGTIPVALGNLVGLNYLDLSFNQLTGDIPDVLFNLPNLLTLILEENELTGPISSNIGNLTNVEILYLGGNELTGSIPTGIGNLTNLVGLGINQTRLTGAIPTQLGNLTNLLTLDLNNADLNGSIPTQLGNLTNLTYLGLGNNRLTGGIPSALGNLTSLTGMNLSSNGFSGEFPVEMVSLPLTSLAIDYNMLTSSNPTVTSFLNGLNPTWDDNQTIPPNNPLAVSDAIGLRVTWELIPYQGDNGHYKVFCDSGTFNAETYTTNKAVNEVIISGLPAGTYTCTVSTFTPEHALNESDLISSGNAAAPISYGGQDVPPNDPVTNPIIFNGFPQQNYSLNIENATRPGDPNPPLGDPNCPVDIPSTADGIHYEIPGNLPTDGIVMNVGGPIWYSNRRDVEGAADTAIVIYEEKPDIDDWVIVACDDDNAPGEVSVSNVDFDLDPTKTYRAVVWNEGEATLGAIIEIAAASFDLLSPPDDSDSLEPPATFTWVPYANTVSYYFKVARTTIVPLDKYSLVELTPDADEDNLTCNALICTLTVVPDSILDEYLTNGNYLWSVGANMSANDSTLPLVNSNQIFRFIIGEVIVPPVNLLENSNFETDTNADKFPDEWTGKNLSKDKRKCNKPDKVVAFEGECAFVFKGSVNEISSIYQKREDIVIISGHTLTLAVQAKGNNIAADTKIIIKIKYQDNDSGKQVLNFDPGEISEYKLFTNTGDPITKAVASVKVIVKNRNLSGKFYIDAMELIADEQAVSSSNDTLLPLPPVSGLTGSGR